MSVAKSDRVPGCVIEPFRIILKSDMGKARRTCPPYSPFISSVLWINLRMVLWYERRQDTFLVGLASLDNYSFLVLKFSTQRDSTFLFYLLFSFKSLTKCLYCHRPLYWTDNPEVLPHRYKNQSSVLQERKKKFKLLQYKHHYIK